jgi:tetratricopeptide (TPR) repeat protein
MDGSAALDEGNRERVRTAAWILFEQNHDRVDQLEQELSADAASNAGFAFYRMGQYDEAAKWFLQTIALDPRRAIAWLNLGDAYINLQKKTEAKDAYEKFLVVAPNSKSASDVCGKIQCLP